MLKELIIFISFRIIFDSIFLFILNKNLTYEYYLPAQKEKKEKDAWLSETKKIKRGEKGFSQKKKKKKTEAHGLKCCQKQTD
jgi:hypothetical protein